MGKSIASTPARGQGDIFELDRGVESTESLQLPTTIPTVPQSAWPATCDLLAKMALDSARHGETDFARRASVDAAKMVASLAASEIRAYRAIAADAALTLGAALLLLEDIAGAKRCFEDATRYFDGVRDTTRAASARVGLAKSLLLLEDPAAQAVLEDAGELFEDLGDAEAVLAIDATIRDFEPSPRSFHGRRN